jgi:hypothetical protein
MTYQNDGLNQTMTEIAIDIIENRNPGLYLDSFKRMFRNVPEMVEEVHPDYKDKLKEVLNNGN